MTFMFDTGSVSVVFGRKWAPWKNCWWKLQEYRQTSADSTYYYIITWAYNRQWSKHYKYRIKGKMRCFITKIAFIKEVNWASWRETYPLCPGSLQCWPCTPPWAHIRWKMQVSLCVSEQKVSRDKTHFLHISKYKITIAPMGPFISWSLSPSNTKI